MAEKPVTFSIEKKLENTLARAGVISTPHGDIHTPAFVVVGTKASVKSLMPEDMEQYVGNEVTLANTYHLFLQPGEQVIKDGGGLNQFAHWKTPTMTDSGGFQVFSLGAAFGKGVTKFATGEEVRGTSARLDENFSEQSDGKSPSSGQRRYDEAGEDIQVPARANLNVYSQKFAKDHGKLCIIDEDGVTFTSHIDGSMHRFTAERSIEIQHAIGADIIIAFDECTSPTADYEYQKEAMDRTHRWAKRSIMAHKQNYEALKMQGIYAVVQGGRFLDLRKESARVLSDMDFDGFGIGGSFSKEDLGESLKVVNEILPEDKPRHLLGIGEPEDIVQGVLMGCDTFDCVAPTRIGRTGTIYVLTGKMITTDCGSFTYPETKKIHILNQKYKTDHSLIDPLSKGYVAQKYTKAYLAHLFRAGEILGPHLASIHNLNFIVEFTKDLRKQLLNA